MSVEEKPAILIYTGHDELIGGDVHYTFDLVNKLVTSGYRVKILTDHNKLFIERANAWLKVEVEVEYLDTRPKLFTPHFIEEYHANLQKLAEQSNLPAFKKPLLALFSLKIGSRPFAWYLKIFIRTISLTYIRAHITNMKVFAKVFEDQENRDMVFHFNNGGFPAKVAGVFAVLMAKRAGVKRIVMTVHNMARKRRLPIDLLCDWIVRSYCAAIITASDRVKNELLKNRKIPANICQTIRCGLEDLDRLPAADCLAKRAELSILPQQPLLLISGNYEEDRKGHRPLLEALARVKLRFPNVLLMIVGSGSDKRKTLLESDIERLGISEQVSFLGYRRDIYELNSIADISLTPSTGDESIPYTIIEAARLGNPVITTTMGGCSEAVDDGVSGFVVVPGDVAMLADKIELLLSDSELRKSMGAKGRELFLDRFLLDGRTEEHFTVYSPNK